MTWTRAGTALLLLVSFAACGKRPASPAAGAAVQPVAASPAAAAAAVSPAPAPAAVAPDEPSLVSFSSGAIVVLRPAEYSQGWSALRLLDERSDTGWCTPRGVLEPQTMVIALAEKTELSTVAFDTGSVDGAGRSAKNVMVEMSDTGPSDGFAKIAEAALEERRDRQTFPVSATVPGRWVRLTIRGNHGATDYTELMEFRGWGRQLTHTPFPDVTGLYDTNYGKFHLKQEGTSVSGCYEWTKDATLAGGIEGRIMKITWTEPSQNGPAIMVFSPDRKQLFGLWWRSDHTNVAGEFWNGTRIADDPGTCPSWADGKGSGAGAQVARELEGTGRSRVYGINFDSDSDRIRDESKPTLESIAKILVANPTWRVTVEGHTDSTAAAAHNQELSERRARAVVASLVASGVAPARLSAAGFGATKPVASNSDPIGRAQNRRVELTLAGKT
jgi:outer membrane protein OmpA-like peptidoglycan-associated protein